METSVLSNEQTQMLSVGIQGLDEILQGGIFRGHNILVEGMPGAGKSLFALEFLYRGAVLNDERGLLVSFERSERKIMQDIQGFGWNFSDVLKQGKIQMLCLTPDEFFDDILEGKGRFSDMINGNDFKRIAIDGLGALREVGKEKGIAVRNYLQLLGSTLSQCDVTTVWTVENCRTLPLGESDACDEHYFSDVIISLRNQARRRSVHRSLEVIKARGQGFISGRHSFKITSGVGMEVFPRVYARYNLDLHQPISEKRTSIGIPEVDGMLGGGLLKGSTSLVVGISGTGKSILAAQFLTEAARNGHKGLFVTLDEHPGQICRNTEHLGLGFAEHVKAGTIRILYDSPLELDIDEHFYKIKRAIEESGAEYVVIDSLAAYESNLPEESHEFIQAVSAYLKNRLVVSLLNYECPELLGVSQISEDLKVSAFVDNIILLNYIEISTQLRRAITIPKSRGSSPEQQTREYIIRTGGIAILEENAPDIPKVPQLPLSSYYGVLARSPTRHSPVIDESVSSGRPMPKSKLPRTVAAQTKGAAKNTRYRGNVKRS